MRRSVAKFFRGENLILLLFLLMEFLILAGVPFAAALLAKHR